MADAADARHDGGDSMRRAVFLDLDGTIIRWRTDYTTAVDEIEFLPGVFEALRALHGAGLLLVVVTNKAAIGEGIVTYAAVYAMQQYIEAQILRAGALLSGYYVCPHARDGGCDCRKPRAGLIFEAAKQLDLDLRRSWLVGDHERDMLAAAEAGCHGLLIGSGETPIHRAPFRNLREAANFILGEITR